MGKKISKFGAEKIIFDEKGLPLFRRCENADCSLTKDYTPEEKGFVKQLDVSVVQRKEYFSENFPTSTLTRNAWSMFALEILTQRAQLQPQSTFWLLKLKRTIILNKSLRSESAKARRE
jgi:hypothetical protein